MLVLDQILAYTGYAKSIHDLADFRLGDTFGIT